MGTFFHGRTTPKSFHDTKYIDNEGRTWGTASIRSVVEWAKTKRGGKEKMSEAELNAPVTCSVGYLSCE